MKFLPLVFDNYPAEDEPDGDVLLPHHLYLGVIVAVYGFLFLWPTYPTVGATLSVVGLLIALDDVVNHAFGVPTPLDWVWNAGLRRAVAGLDRE